MRSTWSLLIWTNFQGERMNFYFDHSPISALSMYFFIIRAQPTDALLVLPSKIMNFWCIFDDTENQEGKRFSLLVHIWLVPWMRWVGSKFPNWCERIFERNLYLRSGWWPGITISVKYINNFWLWWDFTDYIFLLVKVATSLDWKLTNEKFTSWTF